ncbi:MAG TPA: hypothetical protein DCZ94_06760 [Lentisphaeria bacterium]|nr:MAG: hypothetical protein A2X48_10630 [Lentisphaerae bacterium GWF2_49_21]HBC86636.1 hypothetical protein [Lentisphaeria bacterium]
MFRLSKIAALSLLVAFSFAAAAQNKDESLLKKGWLEYRFHEVKKARSYFEEAEKKAGNNKEELLQALTGQAFCHQFLMKNSVKADNFEQAAALYDRCIKEAGSDHKYILLWKSMKAECLYKLSVLEPDPAKDSEAEALWQEVRQKDENSVFAQDAMLAKALLQTEDVNDEKVTSFCGDMEKYLVPYKKEGRKIDVVNDKKAMLAPVMATYLYNIYYYRNDFRKGVDALIDYCKFGPTSFQYKATAYFKVARISETRCADNKTAIEYYTKFFKECGSDSRSYYAMERAKLLGGPAAATADESAKFKKEGE